jgi:hypothetical protein
MSASSLYCHLADQHKVYQQVMVAEELLGAQAGMTYHVHPELGGGLKCPVPGCAGKLHGGWMLWRHFRDLHPFDKVVVLTEGYFPRCEGWLCNAGKPCVPLTYLDARVPDRGGAEVTMGINGTFCIGPTSPVLGPRGHAGMH